MKKYILILLVLLTVPLCANAEKIYTVEQLQSMGIIANDSMTESDMKFAKKVINRVHNRTEKGIKEGKGPFYAEIYDKNGKFIAGCSNSVVETNMSTRHAEINTIEACHQKLKKYNLGNENLSIYINAEPCVMCMGGIMWSGIKRIFYSVPSSDVEKITGFDEGYKPQWQEEFKKRGISVYGNIESENGKKVLQKYINTGKEIYKPTH